MCIYTNMDICKYNIQLLKYLFAIRDLFDVAMDTYDGAEVCELVRTFLLEKINKTQVRL